MKLSQYSKVYIAGPFFCKEEIEVLEMVERILEDYDIEFFSPRLETTAPDFTGSPEDIAAQWTAIFETNLQGIRECDWMLSVSALDTGTVWEAGYAYALGKPILGFMPPLKMNLMIARAYTSFVWNFDELYVALSNGEIENKLWTREMI